MKSCGLVAAAMLSLAACQESETLGIQQPEENNNATEKILPSLAEAVGVKYAPALSKTQQLQLQGEDEVLVMYPAENGLRTRRASVTNDGQLSLLSEQPTEVSVYATSGRKLIERLKVNSQVRATGDDIIRISDGGYSPVEANFLLEQFPESENHENALGGNSEQYSDFAQNFMYRSNGEGFTIFPQFSNGAYVVRLGIFYYDSEGERHDVDIWDMAETYGPEGPWKNVDAATEIINPEESHGVRVDIPKGVVFGFYTHVYSKHDADGYGHEYRSYDEATGEYYKGTFYSYKELNQQCNTTGEKFHEWANPYRNHGHLNDDQGAPRVNGECHAISFAHNGQTFIGFEDSDHDVWDYSGQSWSNYSSDRDFNDIIFWINPAQQTISGPNDQGDGEDNIKDVIDEIVNNVTIPEGIICEADDFQINFNNESLKVLAYGGQLEDGNLKIERYVEGMDVEPVIEQLDVEAEGENLVGAVATYTSEHIADPADPSYALTTLLLQGGSYNNAADAQTAWHNSGRVLFDVDADESFNDLVLDYDFEAVRPNNGTVTSRDRELQVTLHVRAMASQEIDEVGVVINGIARKVGLKNLQWINQGGQAYGYTDAQGNERTFNATAEATYNVAADAQDVDDLLSINVRFHLSAEDIETAIQSVQDATKQLFYVRTTDGQYHLSGIKMPVMAAFPAQGSTIQEAYPQYGSEGWWAQPDATHAIVD